MMIFPTSYLPPIEYFVWIYKEKKVLIERYETYPKQTYRNRCNIYQAIGLLNLIIPVSKPNGNRTLTGEILISNKESWQKKHWRAIESAYNKSPFFIYYSDQLHKYYQTKQVNLIDFNTQLLHFFLKKIGLSEIDIFFTEQYFKNYDTNIDLRESLSPKKKVNNMKFPRYYQVFESKYGFLPNLSIVDLLFNVGPQSKDYIQDVYRINF